MFLCNAESEDENKIHLLKSLFVLRSGFCEFVQIHHHSLKPLLFYLTSVGGGVYLLALITM